MRDAKVRWLWWLASVAYLGGGQGGPWTTLEFPHNLYSIEKNIFFIINKYIYVNILHWWTTLACWASYATEGEHLLLGEGEHHPIVFSLQLHKNDTGVSGGGRKKIRWGEL